VSQRVRDLAVLVSDRVPRELRTRVVSVKNKLDCAKSSQRGAIERRGEFRKLASDLDAARDLLGADVVNALRRLLK
jgi:hypothetical protein